MEGEFAMLWAEVGTAPLQLRLQAESRETCPNRGAQPQRPFIVGTQRCCGEGEEPPALHTKTLWQNPGQPLPPQVVSVNLFLSLDPCQKEVAMLIRAFREEAAGAGPSKGKLLRVYARNGLHFAPEARQKARGCC